MHARLLMGLCVLAIDGMPCDHSSRAVAPQTVTVQAVELRATFDKIPRLDFNRRAAERFLPLFWRSDANKNGAIEPDELVILWGYGDLKYSDLIDGKGFTKSFSNLYSQLAAADEAAPSPEEQKHRELMKVELAQGRTTLIETDLSNASAEEKSIAEHLEKAAVLTERVFARQTGTLGLADKIPPGDNASRMVFHRNQQAQCVAPKTENDPACNALADKPKRIVGLYPADIQSDPKFCEMLAKQPNSAQLMDHFTAVVAGDKPGTFKAVPYSEMWKDDMEAVAKELDLAAAAITSPGEAALKAYLTAQAKAFRTNDWESANEPWAAMGVDNSKWYVRIAPDETYYEPCSVKAGFGAAVARINPESVAWQKKLDPVKGDMEKTFAAMAGAPYKARDVKFKLPDFIDIVLNAGNDRDAHGGTAGQSLPNWGKVAERGGRTVAMTNLGSDEDSRAAAAEQMASLFCPATNAQATTDSATILVTTMLHEACHNLGPAHEYKVKGKTDEQIFGGTLASMMEELKAQSGALYFTDWLADRGMLEKDVAEKVHLRDVSWAFGHISRGMYTGTGQPKTYSQLASIQMGLLMKAGALKFEPEATAANGKDKGCFELDFAKFPSEAKALATTVVKIKAAGDKKGADDLKAQWVDAKNDWAAMRDLIAERWLRAPKASFVYAVRR
jgi:hypothetical protein